MFSVNTNAGRELPSLIVSRLVRLIIPTNQIIEFAVWTVCYDVRTLGYTLCVEHHDLTPVDTHLSIGQHLTVIAYILLGYRQ